MSALWTISANPRRRRKAHGHRKHRTAAQRAATARMLAANRARRGGHAKRRARRASGATRHHAHSRTVVIRANPRRAPKRRASARRSMAGFGNSFMGYLKTGAAGAGGALVVDAGYGFLASMLPVSMQTKVDPTTGGVNYMYYAGKGALAAAVGAFGGKVMPPRIAHAMAAGSFVVMMYEIIRPMVATALPTVNLGWFNPAPVQSGVGAYASTGARRLGAYADTGNVSAIRSPMATHA